MSLKYNLVSLGDESNLTLFVSGEMYVASNTHPNWDKIVAGALAGDVGVTELFDVSATVSKQFRRLTERATVSNGRLYFDGDEMHNALATEVIRFLDGGEDDWSPLVQFLEKVQQNPQQHSRDQLYEWLDRHEFSLTEEGDIVGYKGVQTVDGEYRSISQGTATVNGVVHNGKIPQKVGDVVEMPRSAVAFDPSQGCSAGLHVANFKYAKGWGDQVLAVAVNPRDVVSVPTDSNFDKVRVCRYVITGLTDAGSVDVVQRSAVWDEDDDEDAYCYHCGDTGHYEDECDLPEDEDYMEDDEDDLPPVKVTPVTGMMVWPFNT